jgi:uncharacterized protein
MKKSFLLALASVFVLCHVLYADEAAHHQLAEELLISMGVDKNLPAMREMMVNTLVPPMIQGQLRDDPLRAQRVIAKISEVFARDFTWDGLKKDYIGLYAQMFTEDELKTLAEFFNSPVGKKYVEKGPEVARKSMEIGQRKGMELGRKIDDELKAMNSK